MLKNSYTIQFHGEVQSGHEAGKVKERIAQLFNVHRDEVDPLFRSEVIFKRSGLNKFTAQQYYRKLTRAGAICHLVPDNPSARIAAAGPPLHARKAANDGNTRDEIRHHSSKSSQGNEDFSLCPKCQSTNVSAEECFNCGVIFEKLKKRISSSPDSPPAPKAGDSQATGNYLQYRQKAITILKYVSLYFIVIFTVDNYLLGNQRSLQYIVKSDLDVGTLYYLLGHLGLVWGCCYTSLAKGRSIFWGGLGFASLPGLGLLLLLPSQDTRSSDIKTKVFAVSLIVLSIYWGTTFSSRESTKDRYLEDSLTLREQRNEYPSMTLDIDNTLFESEIEELYTFLDQGFEMLKENSFRPGEISIIAEVMFKETARLFIWINYQQYMQYRDGQSGIEFLDSTNVPSLKMDVCKRVKAGVDDADIFSLSQKYEEWFVGYDEEKQPLFSAFLRDFYTMMRKYNEFKIINDIVISSPEFSFEHFDFSHFSQVEVFTQDDLLFFDFSSFGFQDIDDSLILAHYYRPHKKYSIKERKQVTAYSLVQVQVSPDFPSKYLLNDLSLFQKAVIDVMLDREEE